MKSLLQKTFENAFNETHYKELILNLFNRFDFSREHTLKHQFNEAEKHALNDFIYLGTYEDSQNKNLDVLIAELKGGSKVERARSLQRNLIGKYLKSNLKDSALVAFYSKDNPDWRLSFVKMDYRLDERGVKVEIGTPPKRYSFLVGKTEPSHTAQKQFEPLLSDKKIPIVDEIEKSFSIEKVTKEFYTEIAKKFTELVGGERKISSKKVVEKGCIRLPSTNDDTIEKEFAVRLIGRLLFCWFLKKKKSEKGEPLLTSVLISSDAVNQEKNYYHRFLEPLFFQVLNTPQDKRKDCFRHEFWGKIPFLNGGLFEPHRHDFYEATEPFGHSKHINTLKIPDDWFLELFKLFELYNFTIDESTTIDVDISVDPEMLGRIFENLLAEINPVTGETARKSTGSYYTPRPIVEYMVDESLKQYLHSQIPTLTKGGVGGFLDENKLNKLFSYGDYEVDLTEPEKDAIIDALDRLKIIDPACGSGAFPMGILHKMLLILQKIDPESKKWLSRKLARIDNEILRKELEKKLKTENWDYVHKLGIIQNSIYGVDIQAIAVEISKLRFFLSLIVDEKIDDSKPNRGVVPLPNLEFKFVAANSLIGLPQHEKETTIDFSEADHKVEELKKLREDYFTSIGEDKHKIEEEFFEKQKEMLVQVMNWQKEHKKSKDSQALKLSEWNPFADEAASWFDPEWMFGVKDGFDVVIANPPYVSALELKKRIPEKEYSYLKQSYETAKGTVDFYIYFFERGIKLLKEEGALAYISPNRYLSASYGKALREYIYKNTTLNSIVDYSDVRVFEEASTYPILSFLTKGRRKFYKILIGKYSEKDNKLDFKTTTSQKLDSIDGHIWGFLLNEKIALTEKVILQSVPLNEVCKINATSTASEADEYHSLINEKGGYKLINTGTIDRYKTTWGVEQLTDKGEKYLHPYLPINSKKISSNRHHLYSSPKIIFAKIALTVEAFYDSEGIYASTNTNCLHTFSDEVDPRYILAWVNSKLFQYTFECFFDGLKMQGGYLLYSSPNLSSMYIKKCNKNFQQPFITLVDRILAAKKKDPNGDTSALEKQIDEMVYALYGLTPEEIAIVEEKK